MNATAKQNFILSSVKNFDARTLKWKILEYLMNQQGRHLTNLAKATKPRVIELIKEHLMDEHLDLLYNHIKFIEETISNKEKENKERINSIIKPDNIIVLFDGYRNYTFCKVKEVKPKYFIADVYEEKSYFTGDNWSGTYTYEPNLESITDTNKKFIIKKEFNYDYALSLYNPEKEIKRYWCCD